MFPLLAAKTFLSTNLLIGLAILLLAVSLYMAGLSSGKTKGKAEIQAKWDAETVVRLEAEKLAMVTRAIDNASIKTQHEVLLEQTKESYEALLAARPPIKLTGLRLPKGSCPPSTSPPLPPSSSDTSISPSPSSEGRLPDKIEQDLRVLADDANSCTDALATLQNLLIANMKLNKNRKEI